MKNITDTDRPETTLVTSYIARAGAAGWGLLWLIGVPIPILIVLFLLRGCT